MRLPIPRCIRLFLPFLGVSVWAFGCRAASSSRARPVPSEAAPPALVPIAAASGCYSIQRTGQTLGTERFSITSTQGIWQVRGDVRLRWPVEQRHRYRLQLDRSTWVPSRFRLSLEVAGLRRSIQAERVADRVEFVWKDDGAAEKKGAVPFGSGTVFDFPSPVASAVALMGFAAHLRVDKAFPIRTIAFLPPELLPRVVLQRFVLRRKVGEQWEVEVSNGARAPPMNLQIRPGKMPSHAKTWPERESEAFEFEPIRCSE